MKVTFLGTGTSTGVPVPTCACAVCTSADPRDRRLRPSVLLEWEGASVLIDTGTDLREQALTRRIERIDAILYTHAHADHIMGLDDLRMYNWKRGGPIPAYGSATTLGMLRRTFWYVFEEVEAGGGKPALTLHEVERPFGLLGREVVPVPAIHGRLPVTGWRIGGFAYLTDVSAIPETSDRLLEGLDVLVVSALRRRPHPTHLTFEQSAAIARRVGARTTWFTHLSHDARHEELEAELPPEIRVAWDGLTLDVPG